MSRRNRCREHPRYSAQREPTGSCRACWRLYAARLKDALREALHAIAEARFEMAAQRHLQAPHVGGKAVH